MFSTSTASRPTGQTYSHIVRCPYERIGITFRPDKLTGNAKIAKLYLAVSAQQDVGWFDICVSADSALEKILKPPGLTDLDG